MKEYICIESPNEVEGGMLVREHELIRCKDCKHHRGENACEKDGCYGWYDTDYCSRAERRGEE